MKAWISALILSLALAACGSAETNEVTTANLNEMGPPPMIAAPDGGDWTQMVSETEEGGIRMGNPDAPVKLVEYASISCHVCAEFSEAGANDLQNVYVKSGQVSWEYRPFMLFPTDPGIFMLLRCQGPTPFFHLVEQLYASQEEWMAAIQQIGPDEARALDTMSPTARAAALVRATGLDQFFRQRGMPASRMDSCLSDGAALDRLAAITQEGAERYQVQGTPTFFINGERADVTGWQALEPRLRMAIGG